MKFPFVNYLFLFCTSCRCWWSLDELKYFLSSKSSAFFAQWFSLLYYYVWITSVFWFISPNLSHERPLSLPLLKFLSSNVWMIHWSDPWGYSMTLINRIFPLYSDVFLDILHLILILLFFHLVFFSCLSFGLSFISCVQRVDILYFVNGWAYASRHTILLGIGTVTSIWCQSKYYSLFTNNEQWT